MYKVTIQPQWELQTAAGERLPPRLVELLMAIRGSGSLAEACRRTGLSYRYAWGMLREARRLFGQPMLRSSRGRGAQLSPIGERLVWAEQRIAARLSPTLESLATEVEAELERAFCQQAAPLRLHASHGFGVETLRRFMVLAGAPLDLKYRSPDDAVVALRNDACDLASLHLPIGELEAELLAHYRDRLDLRGDCVLHLATRSQGLVLARGNPKRILGLSDLMREDVRFIHRQPGSGTRLLLECMLARQGLSLAGVRGCDVEELTHAAVAAYVASGLADAGLGLEPPARRYGLDFIHITSERYFFLCRRDSLDSGRLAPIVDLLRSEAFQHELGLLPGYDARDCGRVQGLAEAFVSLR
ncbi:helix-turn-helix transcriptional regulator [Xanthomonas sp. AmX2]|uniref:helix-turn-helix transcriptional regulator n=1 Tax=Xanthomonas sp. TaxID=29446 RepID=UPI00197D946A|nr:substrate-binding domain-containing protein [Xanthomonas sp.]MBN6148924.1 helix-turn-helix transcriptional regulator [Xanthomonas sp.]